MAEFDNKRRCTVKGKVVYKRPVKFFSTADLIRIIIKTVDDWRFEADQEKTVARVRQMADIVNGWLGLFDAADEEVPQFGGGASGGAGAGAEF